MLKPETTRRVRHATLAVVACALWSTSAAAQSAKELAMLDSLLSIADNYIALVVSTHDVNADDSKAAALQLQKMKEIFEDRGDVVGSEQFFRSVLARASDRTVRNMTYMLLVDILKDAGRYDDAEALMRDAIDESLKALEGRAN